MLAEIQKNEQGYSAHFERHLNHPVAEVWAYLTENKKLALWFNELRVEDLREGGFMRFDLPNGSFEKMKITAYTLNSVLEYTWGEDSVRFELSSTADGSLLVLNEQLTAITAHTPRDLAGWHVCLDVIAILLDGETMESRSEEWNKWYERYVILCASMEVLD